MPTQAREEILQKVRSALNREDHYNSRGPGLNSPEKSQRAAQTNQPQREELIKHFERELAQVGGHFYVAPSNDSACDYIERLACDRSASAVVSWNAPIIDEIGLAQRFEAAGIRLISDDKTFADERFISKALEAGIGVTGVDYALADTGTIVLLAGAGRARSASLVAPVHVAIMNPQQILPGLDELMPLLNERGAGIGQNLSSVVTFITGPSRTADIELTIVVGVHGPQQLHVILLA